MLNLDKDPYSVGSVLPEKEVISAEVITVEDVESKSFKIDFSKAEKFTKEELKAVEEFINEMIRQELDISKILKRKNFPKNLELLENFKVEIIK